MKIINPATEEIIADLSTDNNDSIEKKLARLKSGQKKWANQPVEYRLACIVKFGELILANKQGLAEILTSETGKPLQQSLNEISGAQNRIEHLRANSEKWLVEEVIFTDDSITEKIKYEPLGIVANISAWNFPYNVGYNIFLYALVAGNSVLYKPSEFASLTGLQIQNYLYQAGIPKDVFQAVIGDGAAGECILYQDLDGYFFTGSYQTGKHIIQSVASKMVPVQLELGGKDPLYVMEDVVDIKQAATNAAEGAFYNNGQSCCAVERIYVHENIYDSFVKYLTEEVKSYKIGDPKSLETFIGSLTRPQQMNVLDEQVQDAVKNGAKVLTGGKAIRGIGYFYEPTVVIGVDHTMKIMQEESFGPIIGIQKVKTDEEAIDLMNDTSYGLTAAVFSSDEKRAHEVLNQMNTGTVYWNCCDRVSPNVPWSGRGHSGIGSTLSVQGIRTFVKPKAFQVRSSE